jgi:hypothetical protein
MITDPGTVLEVNKSFLRNLGYRRLETIAWSTVAAGGEGAPCLDRDAERWLPILLTWRRRPPDPMSPDTTSPHSMEPIAMLSIARDIASGPARARPREQNRQIEMINGSSKATDDGLVEMFGAIIKSTGRRADDITRAS